MTESDGPKWYVVHVANGSDQRAQEELRRLGVEFYCPMLRERRLVPRDQLSKKQRALGFAIYRTVDLPLFSRYLFVRLEDPDAAYRALEACGIEGVITTGGLKPVVIDEKRIEELRAREVGGFIPAETPASALFHVGEEVKIVEGPFASQVAKIRALPAKPIAGFDSETRLSVCLAMFGRLHDVELAFRQVDKLAV